VIHDQETFTEAESDPLRHIKLRATPDTGKPIQPLWPESIRLRRIGFWPSFGQRTNRHEPDLTVSNNIRKPVDSTSTGFTVSGRQ